MKDETLSAINDAFDGTCLYYKDIEHRRLPNRHGGAIWLGIGQQQLV
jgi:hypothetical protein